MYSCINQCIHVCTHELIVLMCTCVYSFTVAAEQKYNWGGGELACEASACEGQKWGGGG